MDLTETALREWSDESISKPERPPPVALTQAEYEELVRLRRENKCLQMERNSGVVLQYHQKRTDPR